MSHNNNPVIVNTEDMVVLTREQFWAMNPAPGTVYSQIGYHADVIVANEIDIERQEPDDILSCRVNGATLSTEGDSDLYIVFKWGAWDDENRKYLDMHDEAARLMDSQAEQNMVDYGQEYRHDDCIMKRTW